MARKAKSGGGRSTVQLDTTGRDLKRVSQSSEVKKFRNVNTIQGIAPLDLEKTMDTSSTMAENTSITKSCPNQTEDEVSESELLDKHSHAKTPKTGENWSKIVGERETSEGYDLTGKREEQVKGNVKITMDDIKDKIIYWKSAVICYVLGSNPT